MIKWLGFILLIFGMGLYPFSVFYGYNLYFGFLVGFYFMLQIGLATQNFCCLQYQKVFRYNPGVSVLVVGHRENPIYWKNCLESIKNCAYPNLVSVCAFIDGDEEEDLYMQTFFESVFPTQFSFLHPKSGKRQMLYHGIRFVKSRFKKSEYILVVDSDTVLRPDGIHHLVQCIHRDPKNGCATGNIKIFNTHQGILPKIVNARYGYAFTVERSAMSAVGVMNCCSGPFSIYRKSLLSNDILEKFISQHCCGDIVGPGDDRHLTLLLLQEGHLSRQTPLAIATTETPVSIHRYLQQQLRWMRSFYREMSFQIRAIGKQNFYLAVVTVYELFFPFFVLLSFLPTFGIFPFKSQSNFIVIQRGLVAVGILLLRTFLLLLFNKESGIVANLWNLCVFPLYFIFLLPLKFYALLTCPIQSWITSSRKQMICSFNLDILCMYVSILIWWTVLALLFFVHYIKSSSSFSSKSLVDDLVS